MDYLNVTKKEKTLQEQKEYSKPGWVYITKDTTNPKRNNKLLYEYTSSMKSQKITLQPLINHWEKRKREYIELYGEYTYNKMFLCKTDDREYFERLDREYEEYAEIQENSDYEYEYE
jgi:hypothetical protein